MKFVKGISLFFIYPLIVFGLGIYTGISFRDFFYPGEQSGKYQVQDITPENLKVENLTVPTSHEEEEPLVYMETIKKEETLNADTQYLLEEVDVNKDTTVETTWKVPEKYLGMNREQFVSAMEDYALSPPLLEQERGFVGLEVLSFSSEKVVIRMNYAYVEPSENFYLCVEDNYVVVYLDDKKTVYMNTGILLEDLPDKIQQDIIQYMYIEDEEALYNFLESYSS